MATGRGDPVNGRELLDGVECSARYRPGWLTTTEADRALEDLWREVPWDRHRVRLFGREVPAPRLSSWHGDPGIDYRYSGTRHRAQPWTERLSALRARLQADTWVDFNGVLVNAYRNGNDSMGWHSDDEPELGPEPIIASISLGAPRRFCFRRRDRPAERVEVMLEHGSLLWMSGACQRLWQHALPKMAAAGGLRINLTFRRLQPAAAVGSNEPFRQRSEPTSSRSRTPCTKVSLRY